MWNNIAKINWRDYYTENGIKLKIVYYTQKKKKKKN